MTSIRKDTKGEVVTKETLTHFFEDIKDFVKSTAKGTESTLSKKINGLKKEIEITQLAVTEHTKMIKQLGGEMQEMKSEIHQVEKRLSDKIDKIAVSVESHETRLTVVEEKIESHLAVHP